MPNKRESFYLPSRELRATTNADGSRSISGIVAYNSPSVGLPWTETVAPGAFSDALKPGADVLLLRDHRQEALLARTLSKTLKLEDSSEGLKFSATLPNTGYASDTLESISRKDLTGVSFGFAVTDDVWANDGAGNVTRTLLKVNLYELSVTSFAAFPQSSVSLRSVPVEYRSLVRRSYADEDDDEDECDCDCPECRAGNCADCSNPDCGDPHCDEDEERSTWKQKAEMILLLARRK